MAAVADTELGTRLASAPRVRREHAFGFSLGDDLPLMSGVVDLIAHEMGGGCLIVDYKSDRVGAADLEVLTERDYGVQRRVYGLAALRGGALTVDVVHWYLQRPTEPVTVRYTPADDARLTTELRERAEAVAVSHYPVSGRPHRDLCLTCPGRRALCSHPPSATLGPAPDGGEQTTPADASASRSRRARGVPAPVASVPEADRWSRTPPRGAERRSSIAGPRPTAVRPRVAHVARPGRRAPATRELLVRARQAGDAQAREQLVARYLPLARQLARRYQRADEPLDDLIQVASLGLLKAVDRFDTSREVAFSSYAVPTIVGELKRHFRDRTWSLRVPRELQEMVLRTDRAVARLAVDLHRQPTVAEIAAALDASEEQVLEALAAAGAYRAGSLDAPRGASDLDERREPRRLARRRRGGVRHRRDARHAPAAARPHLQARAARSAPALRRGPHAGGDRRPDRRLADAGVAHDPPGAGAPASGERRAVSRA